MRMLLGIVGLLVTLAIVALIARTQLTPVSATAPMVESMSASAAAGSEATSSADLDLPRKIQDDLTRAMQQAPQRDESR